jgi:glycosyltransferase involved in cell wall biosynthesis
MNKEIKQAKNFLIFNHYFPPIKSIACTRNFNLANELAKSGHNVIVFSRKNKSAFPADNSFNINEKKIKVVRVFAFDKLNILNIVKKLKANKKESKNEKTDNKASSKNSSLKRLLDNLLNSFPFNLILGIGGFFYIIFSIIKALKYIKKTDVIISSFPPYSDHVIANILSRFNKKTVWLADFRDPHIAGTADNIIMPKVQHFFNKQILKKADFATVVSEGYKKTIEKFYKNIQIVSNGISTDLLQTNKSNIRKKFAISYTGILYEGKRIPLILFEALKELINENKISETDVELAFAGPDKDCKMWEQYINEYELQKISVVHGYVSRNKSIEIQRQSCINLLLTWSSKDAKGFLTGKFYEYISSGNPVIVHINGIADKEIDDLVNQLNAGIVVLSNKDYKENLKQFILKLYDSWQKTGTLNWSYNTEAVKELTWPVLSRKIVSIVSNSKK